MTDAFQLSQAISYRTLMDGKRGTGAIDRGLLSERSNTMEDDRTGTAAAGKSHSAEGGDYEVEAFARQFGISIDQARNLIDKFGNNKQVLHREAWKLQDG